MLLSRENLNRLDQESKLERIKFYVEDQKEYAPYYKSPGTVSIPESCINDVNDNDEAVSASISEIMRRKTSFSENQGFPEKKADIRGLLVESNPNEHPKETHTKNRPRRENDEQEKEPFASNSVRKRKRMKLGSTSELETPANSKLLPQSKSNGFHLLQKFVSPNLEMNRITIKGKRDRPKLGLFNKGKSSANGKTVPDLVFSESQFLKPRQQQPLSRIPEALSSVFGPANSRPPSTSRFFPPKSNEKRQLKLSNNDKQSLLSTSPSTALRKPCYPPVSEKQKHNMFNPPMINHPRGIQEFFVQQCRKTSVSPDQHQLLPQQYNNQYYPTALNSKLTGSSSSLESIRRLLKECQQLPEPQCTSNSYHAYENQQQVPHYAHTRSPPNYNTQMCTAVNDYCTPWSPNIGFYNRDIITLQNHQPLQEEEKTDSSEHIQVPKDDMRPSSFGLNWQVVDSLKSFNPPSSYLNEQKRKDDLDLVLESPAMCMMNRSNEDEDDDFQNFWLTQSYKRKL